mgnify:CR=1 FL=1
MGIRYLLTFDSQSLLQYYCFYCFFLQADYFYDEEIIKDKLLTYDWLHLHHEDFTGQYGKFWFPYHNAAWYQEQQRTLESSAHALGFEKVSQMKLAVAKKIRD